MNYLFYKKYGNDNNNYVLSRKKYFKIKPILLFIL